MYTFTRGVQLCILTFFLLFKCLMLFTFLSCSHDVTLVHDYGRRNKRMGDLDSHFFQGYLRYKRPDLDMYCRIASAFPNY